MIAYWVAIGVVAIAVLPPIVRGLTAKGRKSDGGGASADGSAGDGGDSCDGGADGGDCD